MIHRPCLLVALLVCVCLLLPPPSLALSIFTPQQREMVKQGLLHRLGLQREPGLARPTLPVPGHMWQIYNDVIEEELDANWIRHYYPTELLEENQGLLLSYNLSLSVQNASLEEVRRADLKIRLQSRQNTQTNRRANVYLAPTKGELRRLLDSRPIDPSPSSETFWMDFDVTDALAQHPFDMLELWLELPPGVSLYSTPSQSLSSIPYSKKQSAALVVFSELRELPRVRRKRTARGGRRKNGRKNKLAVERGLCQKKELYVDFEELNWQDWILAPKGYEAGQCVGVCPSPMPAHLNATNHAIIQSLLHSMNPQVPPPSCVPTETSPLAILYMDIDNRIVIKNYPDMRVDACGCR